MSDERPTSPRKAPRAPRPIAAEAVRTAIAVAGAALMSVGAWMAWPPAGLLLPGSLLFAVAVVGTLRAR